MHTQVNIQRDVEAHGVFGFEAVQEFGHETGLVEGIGYRHGELVRYTAGSPNCSPFQCEPVTIAEALHWWALHQMDPTVDSSSWQDEARARFLEAASQAANR